MICVEVIAIRFILILCGIVTMTDCYMNFDAHYLTNIANISTDASRTDRKEMKNI